MTPLTVSLWRSGNTSESCTGRAGMPLRAWGHSGSRLRLAGSRSIRKVGQAMYKGTQLFDPFASDLENDRMEGRMTESRFDILQLQWASSTMRTVQEAGLNRRVLWQERRRPSMSGCNTRR